MKNFLALSIILFLIFSCSKKSNMALLDKVEDFKISQCRSNCGVDSIGIRLNEVIKGKLKLRFGNIVNCSWENGFLKSLNLKNDTLFIKLHQKPDEIRKEIDSVRVDSVTTIVKEVEVFVYPVYDCDCFFNFDLIVKGVNKKPRAIKVFSVLDNKYWNEVSRNDYKAN